ncbi:hypothetical protein SCHPADRAFT_908806 [Schizopora paradoxa]|uniref:Uncharacterized protein n=1 Tax=Schizopora paradoxa TaxID=27342 RepID=A0A0H2RTQ4_9AGAM|nr:hypothetical protein SCHPADRAFT_908806 [Schizopora paradoxa]
MDPKPTLEKSVTSKDDVALAQRRRQRAAKKDRKRRQRSAAAATHDKQLALAGGDVALKEERHLGDATVVMADKGASPNLFDTSETSRFDWADEVAASIHHLQPMLAIDLPPRDLSCLRTNVRSPWSSLCRRHQRIQRRQNNDEPYRRPQHFQRFVSRADSSTWWRRSTSTGPVRTSQPLLPRSYRRWQPPAASRQRFKSRQTPASLLPLSHLHYKTDRLVQTDHPPSSMSSCSVQTDTPDVQPAEEQPSKTSCAVQTESPRTSDSETQTADVQPSKVSCAVQTNIPPLRTRLAPIFLNSVAETASPRDDSFQALLRFEASPRYNTVLQALEPFHDLLFSYVAHPLGRYEPLPVTLPTDPAMQFVEMYVKGWFKTWLKNKT